MLRGLDDYLKEIESIGGLEDPPPTQTDEAQTDAGEIALLARPESVVGATDRIVLQTLAFQRIEHELQSRAFAPALACALDHDPSGHHEDTERFPVRRNPAYTPKQLDELAARQERERAREAKARAAEDRRRARKQERLEAEERKIPETVREAWRRETYAHRSTPALKQLAHIGPSASKRFVQRARFEQSLSVEDDYSDLLNGQVRDWDATLRDWFLTDAASLATPVLDALKHPAQQEIVEAYLTRGLQPTLGLTHIWLIGLRRALGARDPLVTEWSRSRFLPQTSRHANEKADTYVALQRKADNLAHTVDIVRERYRNPLAHGAPNAPSTAADNRAFCELVYGTPSLAHWLEVGTNPDVHPSPHFGWLSFLTFARADSAAALG